MRRMFRKETLIIVTKSENTYKQKQGKYLLKYSKQYGRLSDRACYTMLIYAQISIGLVYAVGTSQVVQWIRLSDPNAGGLG